MTRHRLWQAAAALVLIGLSAWAVAVGLDRLVRPEPERPQPPAPAPAPATGHITAAIYYGSADGQALVPVQREVPLADGVVAQGREILGAQLADPPEGYLRIVPPGTALRAFYVTGRGDAFIDLSRDVSAAHPGGSLAELLTVYALVNVVTTNLPTVARVQILVDGKEVDTIAGHVDVRTALAPDTSLVSDR